MKLGQGGSSNMLDDTNRKREVRLMKNRYNLDKYIMSVYKITLYIEKLQGNAEERKRSMFGAWRIVLLYWKAKTKH